MAKVLGMDKVMRNLNREMKKLKFTSTVGLVQAAKLIRKEMKTTSPLIPVDWGNLQSSWFIATPLGNQAKPAVFEGPDAYKLSVDHTTLTAQQVTKTKSIPIPVIVIGFSASYAKHVHEMVGDISWTKAGSGPWFFQKAVYNNIGTIVETVRKKSKII